MWYPKYPKYLFCFFCTSRVSASSPVTHCGPARQPPKPRPSTARRPHGHARAPDPVAPPPPGSSQCCPSRRCLHPVTPPPPPPLLIGLSPPVRIQRRADSSASRHWLHLPCPPGVTPSAPSPPATHVPPRCPPPPHLNPDRLPTAKSPRPSSSTCYLESPIPRPPTPTSSLES
jgi:hypothetical protein